MSLEPEAHGPGYNDTELCLRSIAISLKRIADALERQAASPTAPIAHLSVGHPNITIEPLSQKARPASPKWWTENNLPGGEGQT